ncbi:MAG TPA: glycosyltransferase [Vicinamibacterales bacterium]|nr:glycosyltransferase [Vicinamibacterales bacterium]
MKLSPQIPVAIFLTSFHPGGTERQMIELVERLDRNRFDVHLACFHDEGAWRSRAHAAAPVTPFTIRGFARPATMARAAGFASWCRSRRIRVLQTCDLYANTFALPAAALGGVPIRIGSRREIRPDKSPAQLGLQRQSYRFAHKVVANSAAAARQLVREGVPSRRVHQIANGVNAGRFAQRSSRREIRTVVTVANLRQEKAHEVLIIAAARLVPHHPYLRFVIAGDGPRRAELERLVDARGLREHVTFAGHCDDVPALLADADLFALPSRSEAFPNAVMEAMAAGLPIVATAVDGLLDLVEPHRTGVLVPPDAPDALADAIESLVVVPERAAAMGMAARETVRARYSFERMVSAFESLYAAELDARCPGARAFGTAA